MKQIHENILDAYYGIYCGYGNGAKISPKVKVKPTHYGYAGLFYCGNLIAERKGADGFIYKVPMFDSATAMGYYRAFFNVDKTLLGKKGGKVFVPDWIELKAA